MNQTKTLATYLSLPWSYTVETEQRASRTVFSLRVNELPEVMVDGTSLEGALQAIKPLLSEAIQRRIEMGEPVPEPLQPENCKGKIAYRTTPERHYKLAKEAKRRGVSLSRLIDYCVDERL